MKDAENITDVYDILDKAFKNNEIIMSCMYCSSSAYYNMVEDRFIWTGVGLPRQLKDYTGLATGLCPPCAVNEVYNDPNIQGERGVLETILDIFEETS